MMYVCPGNIDTHPKEDFWKFQGGGDLESQNFFTESMKPNWNFPEGGGFKQKTLHGSGMDIFWNNSVTNNPTTFHMIKCLGVILPLCP